MIMFKDMSIVREESEYGFSLVELLVVIVIIGILSAIAVGTFMNQRKKAVDASVQSDLRNASVVLSGMEETLDGTFFVISDKADNSIPETLKRWEDYHADKPINVSDGTIIEIAYNSNYETWNGYLSNEHEYCLKAGNAGGDKYRGVQWGNDDLVTNFAWYDPSFGGVATSAEIYEHTMSSGDFTACYVAGYKHAKENGLPLPPSPSGENS